MVSICEGGHCRGKQPHPCVSNRNKIILDHFSLINCHGSNFYSLLYLTVYSFIPFDITLPQRALTVFDDDESNNVKTTSVSIRNEKHSSYLPLLDSELSCFLTCNVVWNLMFSVILWYREKCVSIHCLSITKPRDWVTVLSHSVFWHFVLHCSSTKG